MKNNKMKISDYFNNTLLFINIVLWIFIIYVIFVSLIIGNILDKDYKTLIILLISLGIIIIIFGYWFYAKINAFRKSSESVGESVELLVKKRTSKDKLKIVEKLALYLYEDKYSIKIGNRIGIALIFIGGIIYIVKYIL
ncbi:hypothetical protein A7H1H_0497 [Aliarcobacter butzleri 7h1h]|nr:MULTISPECIES: hypothetical protein [Arcobacteraceae]AGR76820.1 hypothetical protein A7H1H_0497 [Aliarcobacter butzleri 7h1h]KLE08696.1 hypothetical protein AF79_07955 [Aliarcobacter butzleri L354]MDN5072072.1 hypothetical protein [Aliarcobacter butzleri]MDN5120961.1 hypothetical protein [Aliarcobacter butzleri]MDN5129181.1 hypothetical protein [Aliarcobacter butzleri]